MSTPRPAATSLAGTAVSAASGKILSGSAKVLLGGYSHPLAQLTNRWRSTQANTPTLARNAIPTASEGFPMRRLIRTGWNLAPLAVLLVGCGPKAAPPPPPPEVKVATVLQRDVPIYVEVIGETRGNTEIEIRARVEGFIETRRLQGRARWSRRASCSTRSTRARSRRELAQARRPAGRGRGPARARPPGRRRATSRWSRRTRSRARSTRPPWRSRRRPRRPSTRPRRWSSRPRSTSRYTTVTRAGRRPRRARPRSTPGTLVGRGQSTLLTRISRIDPIHVRFSIPEKDYLTLAPRGARHGAPRRLPRRCRSS